MPGELPAVVLALDPGATSGWAILAGPLASRDARLRGLGRLRVVAYGDCRVTDAEAMRGVVHRAIATAVTAELPLVVVRETWNGRFRKDRRHPKTIAGLGAKWGRWELLLDLEGVPRRRQLAVGQSTWRADVLGASRLTTAAAKRAAQNYARTLLELGPDAPLGDDAAEALCIGVWALRSVAVWQVLPKRLLRSMGLPTPEDEASTAPGPGR